MVGRVTGNMGSGALRALLAAEAISVSGSVMSALAVPWFVLVTTGSATRMAVTLAVEFAATGLAGIPGGALAARLGVRRTLLVSDLLRALLIGLIPVLHWTGTLTFPLLLVLVAAIGCFYTPYIGAQQALLPELVGEDETRLAQTSSAMFTAERTASLVAPAVAGALVGAIGAPAVMLIDCASFLVAFGLVARLVPAALAPSRPPAGTGVLDGARLVLRDRLLGGWAVASGGFEAGWQMLMATLPVIALVRFDADPLVVGVAMGAFGGGAVAGGLLGVRLVARLPGLPLALTAKVVQVLAFWGLVAALPLPALCALLFFCGSLSALVSGPVTAIRTLRVPAALRPAAGSAFLTVMIAIGALGLVAAGPLLDGPGWQQTIMAAAIVQSVATALFVAVGLRARASLVAS